MPAIKWALNRSITEPDHWLRLALVSNNTVCFLQFQMTDRETGTINTFYLLTHSHSVSLSDQSFLLLWLDHQIFLSLTLNTEGFQFSQAMIMFPIFIIMRRKKILKCWWSVLFIYCIAALLLTSPLGLICVWMCFSGGFDTAGKVWAFGNVSVEHLYVCFFYKIMNLHQGGQKNGLFLSGERRQTVRDRLLGELWDYSTVSCWTLSWAGRLMWAKTSNAAQHLTKVKHFLSVSLPVSASRREICSGKSEMKCQEQSDCLGKGDPN